MNKRLFKWSLVAGLALLLALPAIAYSQREGPRGPRFAPGGQGPVAPGAMGAGRMGRRHIGLAGRALAQADRIGLSAEQRDQILAAQRSNQEAAINRRAAAEIGRLELRDLMDAEARDVAAIEAKLRELAEQDIAGTVAALRLDEQVGEILSVEQSEALRETAGERGRPRPGRGGRRMPR